MMPLIRPQVPGDSITGYHMRSIDMTWETPTAIELRFGMEITMYVSNR
jgi:coenzyme PQQ precursor peptide PqqA